jgi:uncharacterized membrane protein YbhN (UPF0104 family)
MRQMSKRTLLAGAAAVAAAGVSIFLFGAGDAVAAAFHDLQGADPVWLVAAGAGFLAASLCSASAWHRGLAACGARLGRVQVTQRYAAGSLANTLAPANAGEVVRVALLSRAMGSEGAVFAVIGVSAVVAVVRASVIAALFLCTAASRVPVLWVAVAVLGVASLFAVTLLLARARLTGRLQHMLDVVRGLAAQPAAALELTAWVVACTGATILASACIGAALGVPHPLAAALVIVPAIELAKALPITPGNVGLTSAAVAIALKAHGIPLESAVAVGITLHAVETVVGLSFGATGAFSLTPAFQRVVRPVVWLRPRIAWAVPGAAPAALVVGLALAAFGAYAAFA